MEAAEQTTRCKEGKIQVTELKAAGKEPEGEMQRQDRKLEEPYLIRRKIILRPV